MTAKFWLRLSIVLFVSCALTGIATIVGMFLLIWAINPHSDLSDKTAATLFITCMWSFFSGFGGGYILSNPYANAVKKERKNEAR